jgi:hypothetical protein
MDVAVTTGEVFGGLLPDISNTSALPQWATGGSI